MSWHLNYYCKGMVSLDSNLIYLSVALFFAVAFLIIIFLKPKYGLFLVLFTRPILDNINPLREIDVPFIGLNTLQIIGVALPFLLFVISLLQKTSFFNYRPANIYIVFLFSCIPSIYISCAADCPFNEPSLIATM